MRRNARERLEHASEERARKSLVDSVIERTLAETQMDAPDAMIDERAGELFHEQVAQFSRYGITEDQFLTASGKSHEEAVAEFREPAEQDVRRTLVVREIIRRESLTVNDQDVKAKSSAS